VIWFTFSLNPYGIMMKRRNRSAAVWHGVNAAHKTGAERRAGRIGFGRLTAVIAGFCE
jgi:hypothetical protein